MNGSLLFGLLVLLVGASIVANALFHFDVPVVRTGIGLFFLFIGAKVLLEAWLPSKRDGAEIASTLMSEATFRPTTASGDLKYDVIFGKGLVDLTALPKPEGQTRVEVNSIFGATTVRMNPDIPYSVEGSAAFGEVQVPDRRAVAFGDVQYTPSGQMEPPSFKVRVNVAFGSAQVVEGAHHGVAPHPAEEVPNH